MKFPIHLRTHPIRFLLYLEWAMLLIITVTEAITFPYSRMPRLPILNFFCLTLLGLMGLRLPENKRLNKIIYTGLEIGLILLSSYLGGLRIFALLYIILVIRSCLIFEQQSRLIVTGLAFILFLLTQVNRIQTLTARKPWILPERIGFTLLSSVLLFGLVLAFLLLMVNAVLSERQSREKLAIANAQLRQYALQIENVATLQERNRIARDIHDSLGHSLTALNIQLETALKLWPTNPAKATEFLAEAKRLGSTALREVRQSVTTLRANPWHGQSLTEAIASLAEDFYRTTNLSPTCNIQLEHPIPAEVKTAVYRIVQESLTNICKYAAATEVKIQMRSTQTNLYLMIQDNGKGFNLEQNTTGFGLQGMQERTLALGGEFEINSTPTSGCTITVNLPLPNL